MLNMGFNCDIFQSRMTVEGARMPNNVGIFASRTQTLGTLAVFTDYIAMLD